MNPHGISLVQKPERLTHLKYPTSDLWDQSKNACSLRTLHTVTFKLCIPGISRRNEFCESSWTPSPRWFTMWHIWEYYKIKRSPNLKHPWSQVSQRKGIQAICLQHLFSQLPVNFQIVTYKYWCVTNVWAGLTSDSRSLSLMHKGVGRISQSFVTWFHSVRGSHFFSEIQVFFPKT